jgi:mannose-6-phosphate isomerase-like protein (cupin superfamily)
MGSAIRRSPQVREFDNVRQWSLDLHLATDTSKAEHYNWGQGCDGWRHVQVPGLSVIEERVPAGCGEILHFHEHAQQFFYVLSGVATMEFVEGTVVFGPRQGLQVPPKTPHRLLNRSDEDLEFLVISSPPTSTDRVEIAGP